jgi:hypothetical protein
VLCDGCRSVKVGHVQQHGLRVSMPFAFGIGREGHQCG